MPIFQLKVLTKKGEIEELRVNYTSLEELQRDFQRRGDFIINYRERGSRSSILGFLHRIRDLISSKKLSDEDVYNLFYELGIMLKAGVPVLKALKMVSEENPRRSLKLLIEELSFKIKGGKSFSEILHNNELYNFTPLIPIIQMGEKTGQLWDSFLKIASNTERWIKIKGEITNALLYPLLLIGTSIVAIYIILAYVIPKFKDIVASFKVVLPFYTAILFKISLFLNQNQEIVVMSVVLFLFLFLILLRNPGFQRLIDNGSYRLPVIKNFRFSVETIRFLNSLSNLLAGGVPILVAFKLSLQNFSSSKLRSQLTNVSMSLKKGELLGQSIKRLDMFPDIIPNMITIGEESGKLSEVLNELYDFLSERYLKKIKKFMNLLEPLIIMFIAIFIGFIVLSIIPIITNLSDINF